MNVVDDIVDQALRLTIGDRAEIACRLLETLDDSDDELAPEEWAAHWGAEIARRRQSIERGESKLLDMVDVERLFQVAIERRRIAGANKANQ